MRLGSAGWFSSGLWRGGRHVAGASIIRGFPELDVQDGFAPRSGTRGSFRKASLLFQEGMGFSRQETHVSRPFEAIAQTWQRLLPLCCVGHDSPGAGPDSPGRGNGVPSDGQAPRHATGRVGPETAWRPSVEKPHLPRHSSCAVFRNRQNKCVITRSGQSCSTSFLRRRNLEANARVLRQTRRADVKLTNYKMNDLFFSH